MLHFCLFSPILFCARTKKKKPITSAVISFFSVYRLFSRNRSSRNRTHIDGFGDHCSTFELCSYFGSDRTDELYYSKLFRQKQDLFVKKEGTGRKKRSVLLETLWVSEGEGNVKFLKALCKRKYL